VTTLASWAGLTPADGPLDKRGRRGRRTERAICDVQRAGYQTTHLDKAGRRCAPQPRRQVVDMETGERRFEGLPSVRRFGKLFFRRLGLAVEMDLAQKQAAKKNRERAELEARDREVAQRTELARLARIKPGGRYMNNERLAEEAATANNARRFNECALRLMLEHPEWTPDAVRAEARRQVATGPPPRGT
jgi:hypothetical protein